MVLACASFAGASATLLLEEPYGNMGFFTATGHAAVYLSGVCAETPVVLRRCAPGETGVVISRYDGVGGYDWVAIPLIPYLYAVERPEDVPLFADAKMALFLRDRYRRKYLEDIAPDVKNGETPGGNWYQLVGSSYDRTIYGFEIETTPEQDDALIRKFNSSPNRVALSSRHRTTAPISPKAFSTFTIRNRCIAAWLPMSASTTPKQMAKRLTKYSDRHPEPRVFAAHHFAGARQHAAQFDGARSSRFVLHLKEIHCAQCRGSAVPARSLPDAWQPSMWDGSGPL